MGEEKKKELKKKLDNFVGLLPTEMMELIQVEDAIEQVIEFEEYKDIVKDSRNEIKTQFEEGGIEAKLTKCPYKTEVLEGGIQYVTEDWLVIYGVEVLEGIGEFTMSMPAEVVEIFKISNLFSEPRNFISPRAIIVPELTSFAMLGDKGVKLKYKLVGEGYNSSQITIEPWGIKYRITEKGIEEGKKRKKEEKQKMRKREVIEEKVAKTCQYCEGAILEVLLDIRELLEKGER